MALVKKRYVTPVFTLLATLTMLGCQNPPQNNKVLAKVGSRAITASEWEFQKNQLPPIERDALLDDVEEALAFNKFLNKITAVEYGKKFKDGYKESDSIFALQKPRVLSKLFHRRFVGENQGYPDNTLRAFYAKKKGEVNWKSIEGKSDFESVRKQVALDYAFPPSLIDSVFKANPSQYTKDSTLNASNFKDQIQSKLRNLRYRSFSKNYFDSLKKQYDIVIHKAPVPDAKAVYEAEKENYKTVKSLYLSEVKGDSSSLSKNDLKFTPVGWVKVGHALPQGRGMFPEIQQFLINAKVGERSKAFIRSGKGSVFKVDSIRLPKVKPFERVKRSIEVQLSSGARVPVDGDFAWVTKAGKAIIFEKNVAALLSEAPPQRQGSLSTQYLLDILISWELLNSEAEKYKVEELPFVKYSLLNSLDAKREVAAQKNWEAAGLEVDSMIVDSLFNKYQEALMGKTRKESAPILAKMYLIPEMAWKIEFNKNLENYGGVNSPDSLEKYKMDIFRNIQFAEFSSVEIRLKSQWKKSVGFEIFESKLKYIGNENPRSVLKWVKSKKVELDELIKNAKDFKKIEGQRKSLLTEIQKALYFSTEIYPEGDGVEEAYFELAEVNYDLKKYRDASWYFERFVYLYPSRQEVEKAIFMKGYLYSEHLNKEPLAVKSFEELLVRFPKSDFADDADFLIRDIKSGRKLSKEFIRRLEQGTPLDSIKEKPMGIN